MTVYFNDKYLPKSEVAVSADDRGFVFGDGAYEVARFYSGQLFEMEGHLVRINRSLSELRIVTDRVKELREISENLIAKNNLQNEDGIVYLQITRGAAKRAHSFPPENTPVTIFGSASAYPRNTEKLENGVKAVMIPDIRWSRCDIKSLNLLPNVLANQTAKENGCDESILVRDGMVTEGSHSNLHAVFGDTVMTYPRCNYILAGITRDTVINICREQGIRFVEEPVASDRFLQADEVFMSGTTVEVTPIVQIDDHTIGNGTPGPITRKVQSAFEKLITKTAE